MARRVVFQSEQDFESALLRTIPSGKRKSQMVFYGPTIASEHYTMTSKVGSDLFELRGSADEIKTVANRVGGLGFSVFRANVSEEA